MRLKWVSFAILSLLGFLVIVAGWAIFGAHSKKISESDWEKRQKNLCQEADAETDVAWCEWLKTPQGSWIEPNPDVLKIISASREKIASVARQYEVDPRAIAGAILAENTLSVDWVDDIQDALVKSKYTPTAEFFGRKFSIGLGQVNLSAALAVEPLAARVENRALRKPEAIAEALLTPGGSIAYVGAILKQAQDAYSKAGFDISRRPEILATLFNLGEPEIRAQSTRQSKRRPRVNYFGFFVEKYLPEIEKAMAAGAVASGRNLAVAESLPGWKPIQSSGMQYALMKSGALKIHVVKFNPDNFSIRPYYYEEFSTSLKDFSLRNWAEKVPAPVLLNGGQYEIDLAYLGQLRRQGKKIGREKNVSWKAFLVSDPKKKGLPNVTVLDALQPKDQALLSQYSTITQTFMLIDASQKIRVQKSGLNDERTVVGMGAEGWIYIFVTEGGVGLWELADWIQKQSGLRLQKVLSLDGADKSALHIRFSQRETLSVRSEREELPSILGVFPR